VLDSLSNLLESDPAFLRTLDYSKVLPASSMQSLK